MPDGNAAGSTRERDEYIESAIEILPEEHRVALLLTAVEGNTLDDAAILMDESEDTVERYRREAISLLTYPMKNPRADCVVDAVARRMANRALPPGFDARVLPRIMRGRTPEVDARVPPRIMPGRNGWFRRMGGSVAAFGVMTSTAIARAATVGDGRTKHWVLGIVSAMTPDWNVGVESDGSGGLCYGYPFPDVVPVFWTGRPRGGEVRVLSG